MSGTSGAFGKVSGFLHHRFLALLLAAYALAAVCPAPGEAIRQVAFEQGSVRFSLTMLMLGVLLFDAGLCSNVAELVSVLRRPTTLLAGVLANVLVPIGFLILLAQGLHAWPDANEAQCLLVGLAVVAAMPVAGSSTAWSQNASGSPALSLGLVVVSTILSPLTTPLTLAAVGPLTHGDYATALAELGGHGTGAFLLMCVVLPSLAGMVARPLLGNALVTRLKPAVKLVNTLVLLLLCYVNAASILPGMAAQPDWDFLLLVLVAVVALCTAAFATGWLLSRVLRTNESQKRSLVYGLGMNNNGTGIVLACSALAAFPAAVLPVLAYNLVQHLVAGAVNQRFELLANQEM
jgi:BASS family bile acid:Na+ symporter